MPGNRYARRKDGNQNEGDKAGKDAGWVVTDISFAGRGIPDSIWASACLPSPITILVEWKMPGEKLTESERKFHDSFPGALIIANSGACAVTQAMEIRAQHLGVKP